MFKIHAVGLIARYGTRETGERFLEEFLESKDRGKSLCGMVFRQAEDCILPHDHPQACKSCLEEINKKDYLAYGGCLVTESA